ncbi:MAG: hypothetical protein SGJ03_07365 [Alphaproteobacteria bacterium]|nr:hypothetical protein [Alphaproteobacteria bacterium]
MIAGTQDYDQAQVGCRKLHPDCFDGRSAVFFKVGQELLGEFLNELGAGLVGFDQSAPV